MTPPALADLHWLLCSPALLAPGALPGVLAGDAALGQRWWQQLDPAALARQLPARDSASRLGRYAEALMQLALAGLPAHRLLASQLPVREAGISLGEYDYLLEQPSGEILHIELAVKFFIALPLGGALCFVGPGLRDALELKLAHLLGHQLRLSQLPAGRAALGSSQALAPMAWLRGRLFYRDPASAAPAFLAADHLRGWWRCWGEPLPQTRADSLWRCLDKRDWLAASPPEAPALSQADWQAALARHFAHSARPLQVAEYAPAAAGGHEIARGMVLPADWPSPAMLASLLGRLAALPASPWTVAAA